MTINKSILFLGLNSLFVASGFISAHSDGEFHSIKTKKITVKNEAHIKEAHIEENLNVEQSASIGQDLFVGDLITTSNIDVLDTATVGTLISEGSISTCDVIVGCNLLMNNSINPSIGNVLKAGSSFIHNFGSNSLFVGVNAGNFVLSGVNNSGIGTLSLFNLTSGEDNTALGYRAMFANTTGAENTAIGSFALTANDNGSLNTAVGFLSMASHLTSDNNTAVGVATLQLNVAGGNNTAVGISALNKALDSTNTGIGGFAIDSLVTGNNNIALGFAAGTPLTSGSDNIYIGNNNGASVESGNIRIGNPVTHTATFIQGIFGATAAGGSAVFVNAAGQLGTVPSSKVFKENIQDIDNISEKLMMLRPVSFTYIGDESKEVQYGFIAEEVAAIFPELVLYDENGNPYSIKYHLLYALLLDEIQTNHQAISELSQIIKGLIARIAALESIKA